MTSSARQKIDRFTAQLFDAEVEKPGHDAIVTKLFADDSTLKRLLAERHGLDALKPFAEGDSFELHEHHYQGSVVKQVSYEEAARATGSRPTWRDLFPIRLQRKKMEAILTFGSDSSRTPRIMGFVDLGIQYTTVGQPYLYKDEGKLHWHKREEQHHALIEVKATWPTQGSLIRQLNLYSACDAAGFHGEARYFVVGPDDSVADVAAAHGYRLVVHEASTGEFRLRDAPPPSPRLAANVF